MILVVIVRALAAVVSTTGTETPPPFGVAAASILLTSPCSNAPSALSGLLSQKSSLGSMTCVVHMGASDSRQYRVLFLNDLQLPRQLRLPYRHHRIRYRQRTMRSVQMPASLECLKGHWNHPRKDQAVVRDNHKVAKLPEQARRPRDCFPRRTEEYYMRR